MRVLYAAAHGGFSRESVPLGGGGAVCDHLLQEWSRTQPFDVELITPAILGARAPSGRALVGFNEAAYARFSRAFERATTEHILRSDPASTVVLVNDISEGPDFAALAARGFRVFTIYHVDVVAYVASIYLRGKLRPETTVRLYRRFGRFLPSLTKLIWEKQEASVRHSSGLIVPSEGMREVLLRCYPQCPREKIHVLPWGLWDAPEPVDASTTKVEVAALRHEYGVPEDASVLLTLSRISPEKGQDLLIKALLEWELRRDLPEQPLWLFICGDAAFMQGHRYLEHLQLLASRLRQVRVAFPGHVTGVRKRAFFALADLYVFPSKHESYGLTLLEALAAGLPAVCLDHVGARSVMREEFGRIVTASELRSAIAELLADERLRRRMGEAARLYASTQRFSDTAARLAALISR